MPLLYALVARRTAVLAEYRCAFSDSTRGGVHMSHTVRGVYAPRLRWPRPLDSVCRSDTGSVFPGTTPPLPPACSATSGNANTVARAILEKLPTTDRRVGPEPHHVL
jgi:hypothetical protein